MFSTQTRSPALYASIQFLTAIISFLLAMALLAIARHRRRKLPPGPCGIPLLGNLLILGPNLHRRLANLASTHGPIMHLRLGTRLWIVISSSAIAKEVYTDNDAALSNHDQTVATSIISYGCSSLVRCPYGPTWRQLRRVFVYELMNGRILDSGIELRRRALKRAVVEIGVRKGRGIKVGELAFKVLVDVMMSTVFGEEKSMVWRGDAGEFRRVLTEVVEILGKANVSDFLPAVSWFDLQGIEREMKRSVAKLDRFYEAMIEERLRLMRSRDGGADGVDGGGIGEEGKDMLARLLSVKSFQLSKDQLKSFIM